MDEISLEILDIFYNENKDKLFIPVEKIGTRFLNEESIQKWYSNIENFSPDFENGSTEKVKEPYLFFAKSLIQIFKYIDFNTFSKNIQSIADELIQKIKENQSYEYVYFIVPEEINKSNMWVTLLLYHYLNTNTESDSIFKNEDFRKKIKFTTNFLHVAKKCFDDGVNYKQTLCIYCDDMSYTGSQLYSNIFLSKRQFNITSEFLNKMNVFIAIPYLTPLVKKKIRIVIVCRIFKKFHSYKSLY